MTFQGWVFLTLVAYFLTLFPCALAFWIEYTTPAQGPGCRSLTILVYACAQFIFVLLSAWSHFKNFKISHPKTYRTDHPWLNRLRQRWVGVFVAFFMLLPAWLAATFTTFAGTLMQITGIYQNCKCNSTGYWKFPPGSTVRLAIDTAYDRHNGRHWKQAGYTALAFLTCVTYMGWWCQRYLREKFIGRVKNLVDDRSLEDRMDQANRSPSSEQRQNGDVFGGGTLPGGDAHSQP